MRVGKNHLFRFLHLRQALLAVQVLSLLLTAAASQTQQTQAPPLAATPVIPHPILDESKGCIVPFTYDPPVHPFITVQVRINKSRPLPFIVDTGAQCVVVLMPWAAEELHLPVDKNTPQPPGSNVVSQRITSNCAVNILTLPGPVVDFNTDDALVVPFPLFENAGPQRVAGIIGLALFRQTTTRFDFDKKTLTFFVDKHPPLTLPPPAATLTMPHPDNEWLRANIWQPSAQALPFIVDSGSTSTILPASDGKDKDKLPRLASGSTSIDNASGHRVIEEALLSSLPLGGQNTPLVSTMLDPQAKQPILGLDVLSRFRVTLDPRNGFMTLEPRSGAVSNLPGASDIELEFRNGKTYISQIVRRVANPTIAVGNRLLSIDGKDINGQLYVESYLLLNGYAGTTATLVVEQEGGKKVTVPWLRRSHFPNVVTGALGLTLVKEPEHPLRIVYVAPGSEAEQQGLKAGYEVTAVNGSSIRDATIESLQELFALDGKGGTRIKTMQVVPKSGEAAVSVDFSPSKPPTHEK